MSSARFDCLASRRDYRTLRQGIGGKCRCQPHTGGGSLQYLVPMDPHSACAVRREGSRARGGGASLFWLREMRMTMAEESSSLSDDSMRVAEAGILGKINATAGATVTSYVMIEAALHILAAWWVASSQIRRSRMSRSAMRMSRSRCCWRQSFTITARQCGFLIRIGSTIRGASAVPMG